MESLDPCAWNVVVGLLVASALGVGFFAWVQFKICSSTSFKTERARVCAMLAAGIPIAALLILMATYWFVLWDAVSTLGLWFVTIMVGTFNG